MSNEEIIRNMNQPLIQLTLGSIPPTFSIYEFYQIAIEKSKNEILEAAKKNQMAILNSAVDQTENLDTLKDSDGRTILHYLALNGNNFVFNRLSRKYQSQMLDWLQIQDQYELQAIHYVAYKGNKDMLNDILKIYETNYKDKDEQYNLLSNLMGFAAYGNQIPLMIDLYQKLGNKLQVNQLQENKLKQKVTPLHLACYNKSDQAAILLMRWKCQINLKDEAGNTPLHICAMNNNCKLIRKLIQRGGSVNIQNNNGQLPSSLTQEKTTNDALRSFRYTWKSLLQLNIKASTILFQLGKRSQIQITIFLIFFLGVNFGTYLTSLIFNQSKEDWLTILFLSFTGITFLSFLLVSLTEPGYQEEGKVTDLQQLWYKCEKFEICFDCFIQYPPRSKHCEFCKRCVITYDHHCPWANNCIGQNNLYYFLIFIFLLFFNFIFNFIIGLISLCGTQTLIQKFEYQRDNYKQAILIILVILEFIFLIPLLNLIITQINNIQCGQTTYERLILEKPITQKRESFINRNRLSQIIK